MNTRARRAFFHSFLLVACLIVGFLFPTAASAQLVGDKATFSDVTTFDGNIVKAETLKGRPVLLYFWASWCPTCLREMPQLKNTYAKYKDKGFEIIALSFREDPAKSRTFFKERGFEFPGGPIDDAYNTNYPNLKGTPTWFLIDREGVIRKKFGGVEEVKWELEKTLGPLL